MNEKEGRPNLRILGVLVVVLAALLVGLLFAADSVAEHQERCRDLEFAYLYAYEHEDIKEQNRWLFEWLRSDCAMLTEATV